MLFHNSGVSMSMSGGTSLIACIMHCDDTPGCIATSFDKTSSPLTCNLYINDSSGPGGGGISSLAPDTDFDSAVVDAGLVCVGIC